MSAVTTVKILRGYKFSLHTEDALKTQMDEVLKLAGLSYVREHELDKKNRIDFFGSGIGIEVKIKGTAKSILKQCEGYAAFDEIKCLILVTSKTIGFPPYINDKPVFVVRVGNNWL